MPRSNQVTFADRLPAPGPVSSSPAASSRERNAAGANHATPTTFTEAKPLPGGGGHDLSRLAIYPPATTAAPLQRESVGAEEEVQMKEDGSGVPALPDVPVASGGGNEIPAPVRAKMENALGADFSGVRIHQGSEAQQVGALAYTRGTNIHFQPGRYDPGTESGQALLGHELTHVVQQQAGRVKAPQQNKGGIAPINADPALEAEADQMGAQAARG